MDRLRSMAFDIIDASDVDSYTDRTRISTEEEDEEESSKPRWTFWMIPSACT